MKSRLYHINYFAQPYMYMTTMTKGYTKYNHIKLFRLNISDEVLLNLSVKYYDLFSNISNGNIQMHEKILVCIGKVYLYLWDISFQSDFHCGAIILTPDQNDLISVGNISS